MPTRTERTVLLGATLLALLLLASCDDAPSAEEDEETLQQAIEAAPGDAPPPPDPEGDEWRLELAEPLARPEVTLTDTSGEDYDFAAETAGQPTLLVFGYTHCPDFCPAHLAILSSALDDLDEEPGEDVEVVFVTVDPDRDDPERMGEYLAGFEERFVGLTSELETIEGMLADLRLPGPVFEETDEVDDEYYVGHPATIVGFDADDEAHTLYPFGIRQMHWHEEIPRLVDEGGRP